MKVFYDKQPVIGDVEWDDVLMKVEIFGQLLPIISYEGEKFQEEVKKRKIIGFILVFRR